MIRFDPKQRPFHNQIRQSDTNQKRDPKQSGSIMLNGVPVFPIRAIFRVAAGQNRAKPAPAKKKVSILAFANLLPNQSRNPCQ